MQNNHILLGAIVGLGLIPTTEAATKTDERPNILWLTFEDTSFYEFGCYGNSAVKTPTIDSLARHGIQFMNAYSNGPQSSPARSSIITGCYSTTYAMDWHRKRVKTPKKILFPQYLRDAGYYCTNNKKTDYNTTLPNTECWDECTTTATYNSHSRGAAQPFFAVFNSNLTHMSRITSTHLDGRRDFAIEGLDPNKLQLPPQVPDIYPVRSDYAFHLEGVNDVDLWVKMFLDDLKRKSLSDNTIVFIFSDHGGCLPRGKAFSYESSYRVPMVVYLPEKWQHLSKMPVGEPSSRMVAFADLASTVLSLAGVKPPEYMQGMAFLGEYDTKQREYQIGYMCNRAKHFIPSRGITDGRYKYVRYYVPYKPDALFNSFQWQMPANLFWDKLYFEGKASTPASRMPYEVGMAERFYDLKTDPFELNDLSGDKKYAAQMDKMRGTLSNHLRQTKDLGLFPMSARMGDVPLYERVRKPGYDLEKVYSLAELTANVSVKDIPMLKQALRSDLTEIKFWAVVNMAILARNGKLTDVPDELVALLDDKDSQVAYETAYALCYSGKSKEGFDYLATNMSDASALEVLSLDKSMRERIPARIIEMLKEHSAKFDASADIKVSEESDIIGERKVLVNLGYLPAEKLYGEKTYAAGLKVNQERRKLMPTPFVGKEK